MLAENSYELPEISALTLDVGETVTIHAYVSLSDGLAAEVDLPDLDMTLSEGTYNDETGLYCYNFDNIAVSDVQNGVEVRLTDGDITLDVAQLSAGTVTELDDGIMISCGVIEDLQLTEGVIITGDTFYEDVSDYTADGYTAVAKADGIWVVKSNDSIVTNSAICGSSISLGKDLTFHIYAQLADGQEDAQMVVTINSRTETLNGALSTAAGTSGLWKYSLEEIPPQCMGDSITCELVRNGETLSSRIYSIKSCCDKISG